MSDLLAPVLCEIKCEAEAFWCFVGLMQRAIFVCTPTDNDMDNNLVSPCARILIVGPVNLVIVLSIPLLL